MYTLVLIFGILFIIAVAFCLYLEFAESEFENREEWTDED